MSENNFKFPLRILSDVWHKVGEEVNFEHEDAVFEVQYFTSRDEATKMMEEFPTNFSPNTFIYEALFTFPSMKELVQILIDERYGDNNCIGHLFSQKVKIISRIDPE